MISIQQILLAFIIPALFYFVSWALRYNATFSGFADFMYYAAVTTQIVLIVTAIVISYDRCYNLPAYYP